MSELKRIPWQGRVGGVVNVIITPAVGFLYPDLQRRFLAESLRMVLNGEADKRFWRILLARLKEDQKEREIKRLVRQIKKSGRRLRRVPTL